MPRIRYEMHDGEAVVFAYDEQTGKLTLEFEREGFRTTITADASNIEVTDENLDTPQHHPGI